MQIATAQALNWSLDTERVLLLKVLNEVHVGCTIWAIQNDL